MQQQPLVCVAYAAQTQQYLIELPFVQGMTVQDAIDQSGLVQQLNLTTVLAVGIFGLRVRDMQQCLEQGDRVEIYRPLTINPKDIRRKRAAANPVSRYCRGNRFKHMNT